MHREEHEEQVSRRFWISLIVIPALAIALGISGWYARRLEGLCFWGMENVGFFRGYDGKYGPPLNNSNGVAKRQLLRNAAGQIMCFKENGSDAALPCAGDTVVSCTTFNILAPIYKRMNGENARESDFRENWVSRNRNIIKMLLSQNSSIICLQEFWISNDELVELYEQSLGGAGYDLYMLARTNNRGDGLLTAVKTNLLKVLDHEELAFNDCGDRVAQFMRLQSRIPLQRDVNGRVALQEVLLVNTHLIFPHNSSYCLVRLRQVYKILKYIEEYKRKNKLWRVPVLLCGDWNGSKRGQVYKFLRSQGFISSYDAAHQYTDSEADAHRWVSHRNHRGNVCGVDFIWFLNPSQQQSSLRESWKAAVFGIIKSKLLREHGKEGREAFCFFQGSDCNNCVTYEDFYETMTKLELTKEDLEGLTKEEIEELIRDADFDGNGVIDYKEFEGSLLSPQESQPLSWSSETSEEEDQNQTPCPELVLRDAFFHLPEVEQGTWPEHYSLSDHAPLTALFSSVLC